MAYVVPIHRATSVKHALKLELLAPKEECLVLAKANILEIWSQTEEGFSLIHTRSLYGKIEVLEKVRPSGAVIDHLFIGTDRYTYFSVAWDQASEQLQTKRVLSNQADKTSRRSQVLDRCQVDPTASFLALLLFEGIVNIIPLWRASKNKVAPDEEGFGEPVTSRISEFHVRSSTFLYARSKDRQPFKLAFLFEDNQQRACISVRSLDYSPGINGEPGSADLERLVGVRNDLELGASHLIPVPAPAYGFLVLCETSICYLSDIDASIVKKPLNQATQFAAWTSVDDRRWLLADVYGKLYFLMITLDDDNRLKDWNLDLIGSTPEAATLVYLDGGLVFVGSHGGNSQIYKIQREIELVQTLVQNLAPILDFTIMDMGNRSGEGQVNEYSSGQARIVTGSGGFVDGSLRSVRSGVGLEEQGTLPGLEQATDVFALRSRSGIAFDDALVVSFVFGTRVFQFQPDGEMEEQTTFKGFHMTEETLLASTVANGCLLQVTASGAILSDLEDGMVLSTWTPSNAQPITAASTNESSLFLSVGGTEAVILEIKQQLEVKARTTFPKLGQIACIHVTGIKEICIAGFWESRRILILSSATLEVIEQVTLSDDALSVPRSLLLTHIVADQDPTLFIGMANGEVFTFSVNLDTMKFTSKKIIILGSQPANFKSLPRGDGLSNVFATCEHPSLIYGSDGRMVFSAVNADKATSVCSFNSELFPGAIAIATPEDVKIAQVDTERTTNVNSLPLGLLVRRVAYSPSLKAFGLGTIERSLMEGTKEVVKSHFKLADEVMFELLDSYALDEEELVESVTRAELREDSSELLERFVVGTAFLEDDSQRDPDTRGRILVFAVNTERRLKLITELNTKGACRELSFIKGNIIAALVKTVVIYSLRDSHLHKIASYRISTGPVDLAIDHSTSEICVADLMKSISVLKYIPASASNPEAKLKETARHWQTAWSTACAYIEPKTWLESDADGNVIVLKQNTGGVTADDKRRLEVISEIRLGEMVNRICEVKVEASPGAPVVPKAFMATVDGGVYLFGQITPTWLDLLLRLQGAMAGKVVVLGKGDFNGYRAYWTDVRESQEPYRFVDGELIEQFLDLPKTTQDGIVGELGEIAAAKGGIEGIKELVEGLRRLH